MRLSFWFVLLVLLAFLHISSSFLWKSRNRVNFQPQRSSAPQKAKVKGQQRPDQRWRPQELRGQSSSANTKRVGYPQSGKKPKKGQISPGESKKPVIFFPSGEDDCGEVSSGGGFSTFSFLAFILAVYNLVSLVANNANNNNNNNNNNNDNNNNDNVINESSSNNNANVMSSVMIQPPGVGRKRRNIQDQLDFLVQKAHAFNSTDASCSEQQAAVSAMSLLDVWMVAMTTNNLNCTQKLVCDNNRMAVRRGPISSLVTEVGSLALARMLPSIDGSTQQSALQKAATLGRNSAKCDEIYQFCTKDEVAIAERMKNELLGRFGNYDFGYNSK